MLFTYFLFLCPFPPIQQCLHPPQVHGDLKVAMGCFNKGESEQMHSQNGAYFKFLSRVLLAFRRSCKDNTASLMGSLDTKVKQITLHSYSTQNQHSTFPIYPLVSFKRTGKLLVRYSISSVWYMLELTLLAKLINECLITDCYYIAIVIQ